MGCSMTCKMRFQMLARRTVAAEAEHRRIGQLTLEDREHQLPVVLRERADRVVEEHPARRVQQQARKGEPLLLVERQLAVPAISLIERRHEVPEIDPLERGA